MSSLAPWPRQWVHGCNSEPKIQVHCACPGLYVLRQSKQVNFEGNFIYLIIGQTSAILFDTGAVSNSHCNLTECVMNLITKGTSRLPLIVAHTHSHGDHIGGDVLFRGLENVTIVEHGIDAVSQFFGFTPYNGAVFDESSCSSFDLGERYLDIFHLPGHYHDHISVYDRKSGALITGDFIYPGRLYVNDRTLFHDSLRYLNQFCQARKNAVSAVLGAHIEMTNTLGCDYPDGTLFQPDEAPLALTIDHVARLFAAVEQAHALKPSNWGVLNIGFCIVVPTDMYHDKTPLYVAGASQTCIALISEVYVSDYGDIASTDTGIKITPQDRLTARLLEARQLGATIAVLPELPMDRWYPVYKRRELDSTADSVYSACVLGMHDYRIVAMSTSARLAGITVVGGVIMRAIDLPEGLRDGMDSNNVGLGATQDDYDIELQVPRNVTLIFSGSGELIATHMKRHLPAEEGFWEGDYYSPPPGLSSVKRGIIPGFPLCVQTCSDIMRPASAQIMGALGSAIILNPRATEAASSDRWRNICVGIAATTASYVLSVPRPNPEGYCQLGGSAFCISPTGEVLSQSPLQCPAEDTLLSPITLCNIEAIHIGQARVADYPGYLRTRAEEYMQGWKLVAEHLAYFNSQS